MRKGTPARSSAISRPLAALAVARTSDGSENEGFFATRLEGAALQSDEPADADFSERQQLTHPFFRERRLFGRALDLDEGTRTGHDDVHVHLGGGVFHIVEIEHRAVADQDRKSV